MARAIGIDLGTTNSCVAFLDGHKPKVIHNRQGQRTTPSVVAFTPRGETLVGALAQRQAATNPAATVFGQKRLIGRKLAAPELQSWMRLAPYRIVGAENGDAWVELGERKVSPEELSAYVLEDLKQSAEDYLGEPVGSAVVTVPAYFNDNQRQATRDAARIAGLRVDAMLNEPTAAALGYGVGKPGGTAGEQDDQTLAVFDLGGGTFDVTILRKTGPVFEVLATHGDTFLGGDDFDARLVRHVIDAFAKQHRIDLTKSPAALYRIKEAAEACKRELSAADQAGLEVPFIAAGPSGPLHASHPQITRHAFETLCADLIERLEAPCLVALDGAKLRPQQIDQVLLVGGMTRMPAVRRKAQRIFGRAPRTDVDPDEAVAIGAAIQCGILSGELDDAALLDVTPYALGVRVKDGRMVTVIPKNCAIPTKVTRSFGTTTNYQLSVMIEVCQGEHEQAALNTALGRFELGKLPLMAAGQVQVDVTFALDADGVLEVTAREVMTGSEASVSLTPAGGLPAADVQRLARVHRGPAA
jgi:molecular chaperone DnaK